MVGFGIVSGQEDDVVLVELIGAIGASRGARVFEKWRVREYAEEALGGGGFTVREPARIIEIHGSSN